MSHSEENFKWNQMTSPWRRYSTVWLWGQLSRRRWGSHPHTLSASPEDCYDYVNLMIMIMIIRFFCKFYNYEKSILVVAAPLEEDTQHRRALHEFQVLCTHRSPARRISPSPTSWSPPTSWSSPSRWSRRRRKRCKRPDAQIICCHCCSFPRDCTTTRTKDISQKWEIIPKSGKFIPKS